MSLREKKCMSVNRIHDRMMNSEPATESEEDVASTAKMAGPSRKSGCTTGMIAPGVGELALGENGPEDEGAGDAWLSRPRRSSTVEEGEEKEEEEEGGEEEEEAGAAWASAPRSTRRQGRSSARRSSADDRTRGRILTL